MKHGSCTVMPPSPIYTSNNSRNLQRNYDVRSQSDMRKTIPRRLPVLNDAERAKWERYTNKSAPSPPETGALVAITSRNI